MSDVKISVTTPYMMCIDRVTFDLDDTQELLVGLTRLRKELGVQLQPLHLTDGCAYYRVIGDVQTEAPGNPPSSNGGGVPDPQRPEFGQGREPSVGTGGVAPKPEHTENGRQLLVNGRPVLIDGKPLLLPPEPKPKVPPVPGHARTDLTMTGEASADCLFSDGKRYMLTADQLPTSLAVGKCIEAHGVRVARITVVVVEISSQLELDLLAQDG